VTQSEQSGSEWPEGWLCATCTIPLITTSATQTIPSRASQEGIGEERARSLDEKKRMIFDDSRIGCSQACEKANGFFTGGGFEART
jgi:hypothetical protein